MTHILAVKAATTWYGKFSQMLLFLAIALALVLVLMFLAGRAKGRYSKPVTAVLFLGPALVLVAVGLVYPAIKTVYYSFFNDVSTKFIGGKNYVWVFTDPDEQKVLINTILWVIVAPILSTALGLTLALLIDKMKRESVPKSLIFMPMAISFVGASIIWKFVYAYSDPATPQIGLLSQICIWLHITPPNWLLLEPWNNFLLMVIMIWVQTGFAMVVLSAAIKAIPADVLEAANLDGATGLRLFRRVTLPMIRGTVIVVLSTITIAVLKIFDIVRTMTGGNFGTNVVANEMYDQSFVQFNVGRGSALAVVLFVAVTPLVAYNIHLMRKERAVR